MTHAGGFHKFSSCNELQPCLLFSHVEQADCLVTDKKHAWLGHRSDLFCTARGDKQQCPLWLFSLQGVSKHRCEIYRNMKDDRRFQGSVGFFMKLVKCQFKRKKSINTSSISGKFMWCLFREMWVDRVKIWSMSWKKLHCKVTGAIVSPQQKRPVRRDALIFKPSAAVSRDGPRVMYVASWLPPPPGPDQLGCHVMGRFPLLGHALQQ